MDFTLSENTGTTIIGGVYGAYGRAKGGDAYYGNGDIKPNAYSIGGTLTSYAQNGFYVDGVAQYTWFDSDLNSDTHYCKEADGDDGSGYTLSAEADREFTLQNQWSIRRKECHGVGHISDNEKSRHT